MHQLCSSIEGRDPVVEARQAASVTPSRRTAAHRQERRAGEVRRRHTTTETQEHYTHSYLANLRDAAKGVDSGG
jgi:hypothetical protein